MTQPIEPTPEPTPPWKLGPAQGGENIWTDGDRLLIAVDTPDGWDFALVSIVADEDSASMNELGSGDSFTEWGYKAIHYWIHVHDIPKLWNTRADSALERQRDEARGALAAMREEHSAIYHWIERHVVTGECDPYPFIQALDWIYERWNQKVEHRDERLKVAREAIEKIKPMLKYIQTWDEDDERWDDPGHAACDALIILAAALAQIEGPLGQLRGAGDQPAAKPGPASTEGVE